MAFELIVARFDQTGQIGHRLLVRAQVRCLHLVQRLVQTFYGSQIVVKAGLFRSYPNDLFFVILAISRLAEALDRSEDRINV